MPLTRASLFGLALASFLTGSAACNSPNDALSPAEIAEKARQHRGGIPPRILELRVRPNCLYITFWTNDQGDRWSREGHVSVGRKPTEAFGFSSGKSAEKGGSKPGWNDDWQFARDIRNPKSRGRVFHSLFEVRYQEERDPEIQRVMELIEQRIESGENLDVEDRPEQKPYERNAVLTFVRARQLFGRAQEKYTRTCSGQAAYILNLALPGKFPVGLGARPTGLRRGRILISGVNDLGVRLYHEQNNRIVNFAHKQRKVVKLPTAVQATLDREYPGAIPFDVDFPLKRALTIDLVWEADEYELRIHRDGRIVHMLPTTKLSPEVQAAVDREIPGGLVYFIDLEGLMKRTYKVGVLKDQLPRLLMIDLEGKVQSRLSDPDARDKIRALPKAVRAAIDVQYPGAMIYGVDKRIRGGVYDIDFSADGFRYEAFVEPGGHILDVQPDKGPPIATRRKRILG